MKGFEPEEREAKRADLDGRILDALREGPQTQSDLVTEFREPREQIRSRLQFLDAAGYIESRGEETVRYELREDPRETGFFEEHPSLRPVAFVGVFLLSGVLSYAFLRPRVELPFVAVVVALPVAFVIARIVIAPRQPEDSHTPIQRHDPAGGPEGGKQAGPKWGPPDDSEDS